MELDELLLAFDEAIGSAEDICLCVSEYYSTGDGTFRTDYAKQAFDKVSDALNKLRSARIDMKPAAESAYIEFWKQDRS